MLMQFFKDLTFGVWLLRRSPGFAAVSISCRSALGLAVGATAVFTLVNAIVLRTLPGKA